MELGVGGSTSSCSGRAAQHLPGSKFTIDRREAGSAPSQEVCKQTGSQLEALPGPPLHPAPLLLHWALKAPPAPGPLLPLPLLLLPLAAWASSGRCFPSALCAQRLTIIAFILNTYNHFLLKQNDRKSQTN